MLRSVSTGSQAIRWVSTDRQAMFSDAVFSIVATIFVVTVELPEHDLRTVS